MLLRSLLLSCLAGLLSASLLPKIIDRATRAQRWHVAKECEGSKCGCFADGCWQRTTVCLGLDCFSWQCQGLRCQPSELAASPRTISTTTLPPRTTWLFGKECKGSKCGCFAEGCWQRSEACFGLDCYQWQCTGPKCRPKQHAISACSSRGCDLQLLFSTLKSIAPIPTRWLS